MHLIARLYDAEGVEIETLDGPAEDIARRIGEFALLHGADPDGAGEAARPGRIEFEPYKGRDDDTPVIGTAVFQGEAWVNDHASPVDDSRYAYPITEAEYAEAWRFREVQAFAFTAIWSWSLTALTPLISALRRIRMLSWLPRGISWAWATRFTGRPAPEI